MIKFHMIVLTKVTEIFNIIIEESYSCKIIDVLEEGM